MIIPAFLSLAVTYALAAPVTEIWAAERSLPPNSTTGTGNYYVGYWSAWHGTGQGALPTAEHLKGMTHIILAFANIDDFNGYVESTNTLFDGTTPAGLRAASNNPNLKVMAAFGGWNLDGPFRPGVQPAAREQFASNMMDFVNRYDLDGVDLDWEYPVGNGAAYLLTGPEGRPEDLSDTQNFIEFMKILKGKLGTKLLSAAIPAKEIDMKAYTAESIPEMEKYVDFWNIMSYDFVNRRDQKTGHHAGGMVIQNTITAYAARGMTPAKMVIGYPMYAKWFILGVGTTCTAASPIGCSMPTYETADGGDTGTSGAWMMNDALNAPTSTGMDPALATKLSASWALASAATKTEFTTEQASAFYDAPNQIFWTWVSPQDITSSCAAAKSKAIGGFMVWSIDQDVNGAAGGPHFDAVRACI